MGPGSAVSLGAAHGGSPVVTIRFSTWSSVGKWVRKRGGTTKQSAWGLGQAYINPPKQNLIPCQKIHVLVVTRYLGNWELGYVMLCGKIIKTPFFSRDDDAQWRSSFNQGGFQPPTRSDQCYDHSWKRPMILMVNQNKSQQEWCFTKTQLGTTGIWKSWWVITRSPQRH